MNELALNRQINGYTDAVLKRPRIGLLLFIILASSIGKPLAYFLNAVFGLGRVSFVAFSVVFVGILLRPHARFNKKHLSVYLLLFLMFAKGTLDFVYSGISLGSFFLSFAGFRRIALPFALFIYFSEKLKHVDVFDRINIFLKNWFIFVVILQFTDFVLMNSNMSYFYMMHNIWNSHEVMQTLSPLRLKSHIPFLFETYRCFGLYIDFHASGLYIIMLYAYNLNAKNKIPFVVHFAAILACLGNGSLQYLLVYVAMWVLSNRLVYRFKMPLLIIGAIFFFTCIEWLADVRFPFLSKNYMFHLIDVFLKNFYSYFIEGSHLWKFLWGVGGRIRGDGLVLIEGIDYADIGFVRLIMESGFLFFILFPIALVIIYLRFVTAYKHKEPDCVKGAVVGVLLGLISLIHTPVLFAYNNVTLLMLFLSIIVTQRSRETSVKGQ